MAIERALGSPNGLTTPSIFWAIGRQNNFVSVFLAVREAVIKQTGKSVPIFSDHPTVGHDPLTTSIFGKKLNKCHENLGFQNRCIFSNFFFFSKIQKVEKKNHWLDQDESNIIQYKLHK